jgi:hypothetical protein
VGKRVKEKYTSKKATRKWNISKRLVVFSIKEAFKEELI